MEYNALVFNTEDQVLTITINRPKALNALNRQTMKELHHFFHIEAPLQTDIRGYIITGAGEKGFVAGADIKEFLELDASKGKEMAAFGHEAFNAIEQCSRPVIAAVNGFALGGGCELAMACHMRLASDNAKFGQPEVALGIIPGYGGTQRLIQCIGKSKAIELLLTGDMISAEQALQLGLVNYVHTQEELIPACKKILAKIAKKGPLAIQKTIEAINAYYDHSTDGFGKEIDAFGEAAGTGDFKEGATAFIEKRKANFKGQ